MATSYSIQCVSQIAILGAPLWNALMASANMQDQNGPANPFCRYEYLHALELSGCVGEQTGWRPMHLVVSEAGQIGENNQGDESQLDPNKVLAVMPLYLKGHSYGEYVFDWAWAQAYECHGLEYYPKLVNAIPFTPVTGSRIGFRVDLSEAQKAGLIGKIGEHLDLLTKACSASSWHSLFLLEHERLPLVSQGYLERLGTQFHWFNKGYQSFDDFLSNLTSRRRKSILKERRAIVNAGLKFRFIDGVDITEDELTHFVHCYQRTYYKRSGHQGYLNAAFFSAIVKNMADNVRLLMVECPQANKLQAQAVSEAESEARSEVGSKAEKEAESAQESEPIAAALYFVGGDCLYGRYWGALEEIEGLHFETCYYQGIEYAIAQGLKKFDAGAQGEHKVLRGFEPIPTYSVHEILHSDFRRAIADFIEQEARAVKIYMSELEAILPFKREGD
ncbi:GNAT family N-acetyltransferase [Shewanella spartinae]|uniref:GNAT family N-acetyltransferase n=1 Tax=Shewanella spartinae TaxID=2864205 RepID=UPI003313B0D7